MKLPTFLRVLALLLALTIGERAGAQSSCIENGGTELCFPLLFTPKWCYRTNTTADGFFQYQYDMGLGIDWNRCFASHEEAIAAFEKYFSPAYFGNDEITNMGTPYATQWVNGEVTTYAQKISTRNYPNEYFTFTWSRTFICYPGTYGQFDPQSPTYGPNVRYKCTVSEFPPNADGCPLGNPIHPGTGRKTEASTDFADGANPDLLRFSRHYDSLGGTGLSQQFVGRKWTSSAAVTLWVATAGYGASTTVQRADGKIEAFKASPTGMEPIGDAEGRLVRQVNTSGATTGWTYYGADDRIYLFSAVGLLLAEGTPDGRSLTYSYADATTSNPLQCRVTKPAPGQLWCISDQLGRKLDFEYDGGGRLTRLTDTAGQVIVYGYDEAGYFRPQNGVFSNVLTSVTYPGGEKRYYHYNELQNVSSSSDVSLLTGISDEVSAGVVVRFAAFKYDFQKKATATTHASGIDSYTLQFPSAQGRSWVDPLGTARSATYAVVARAWRPTAYSQPAGAGCGPASSAITYDASGNVASRTDFNGIKTCYAYGGRNLEVQRLEGLASSANCASSLASPPVGSRLTTTQWHPDLRLQTRIAEPRKITTIVYNGQGASCSPSLAADGKPAAVICSRSEQATSDDTGAAGFAATSSGSPRTRTYTYTTNGRLLTVTDPNGKTSTTTYYPDDDSDMGRRGSVATVSNAANHVTRTTGYNLQGKPTQVIDPNGLVTNMTYDARLRLRSQQVGNELTTYEYDSLGQLAKVTHPDGASVTYTYDAAKRLTGITDHKGNRVVYTLDAMGNRVSEQFADPSGALVRNLARSMDALNRVKQVSGGQ